MDYTYFDKECYHHIDELDNLEKYDLFISMFDAKSITSF